MYCVYETLIFGMLNLDDLHIGDKVQFLDTIGGGRIAQINADKRIILIEDEDGFIIPTPLSQVVLCTQPTLAQKDNNTLPHEVKTKITTDSSIPAAISRRAKAKKEPHKEPILEVDLHISALCDNWQHLERGEMLRFQLNVFQRTMQENIRNKGSKIIFIHGRGEGVLKAAIIHELNKHYQNCEYQDASFAQYGFGATMVIIK